MDSYLRLGWRTGSSFLTWEPFSGANSSARTSTCGDKADRDRNRAVVTRRDGRGSLRCGPTRSSQSTYPLLSVVRLGPIHLVTPPHGEIPREEKGFHPAMRWQGRRWSPAKVSLISGVSVIGPRPRSGHPPWVRKSMRCTGEPKAHSMPLVSHPHSRSACRSFEDLEGDVLYGTRQITKRTRPPTEPHLPAHDGAYGLMGKQLGPWSARVRTSELDEQHGG